MNFYTGDYYELPVGATNISLTPQIAVFESGKTKFEKPGSAILEFDIGGKHARFDINVEKAKINLILINGQSNASGEFGIYREEDATFPHLGSAYVWDFNRKCFIEDFHEPTPQWEPLFEKGEENKNSPLARGFYSALADELYNLGIKNSRVEKSLIVHSCRGGAPISDWIRTDGGEGDLIEQAVRRVNSALDYIRENSDKYELSHLFMVWLQGEGAADENGLTDAESYFSDFTKMAKTINDRLSRPLDFTAIMAVRADQRIKEGKALYLQASRLAQYASTLKYENFFIASNITESWNNPSEKYFFDGEIFDESRLGFTDIHYSQKGYDIMGKQAARSIYAHMHKNVPVSEIRLISSDGLTHYKSGDVISISENKHIDGLDFGDGDDVSYLIPYTLPLGAKNHTVEFGIYDKDNKKIDGAINEVGVIHAAKVTYPATLICKATAEHRLESVFKLEK